ncbi:MAG: hypothetical protein ACM3MB_09240 [Acidobacteriota bacterium]
MIRLAAGEMKDIGRTVGVFYAFSTAGSFIGTVLTGFVMIAYFSVGRIFEFIGLSLLVLSVFYYTIFRKKWLLLPVLFLPLLLPHDGVRYPKADAERDNGHKAAFDRQFLREPEGGGLLLCQAHTREMIIDGLIQGGGGRIFSRARTGTSSSDCFLILVTTCIRSPRAGLGRDP